MVLTAYSAFYGIAAALWARESDESHRVSIGAYYGFWVWLPMLLMYPGTDRLHVHSDGHALAASVVIGLGQTVYVWYFGSWSRKYVSLRIDS